MLNAPWHSQFTDASAGISNNLPLNGEVLRGEDPNLDSASPDGWRRKSKTTYRMIVDQCSHKVRV